MEISRIMFIAQSILGAFITCLALYTFINIGNYSILAVETQLNMIWFLIALVLLVYGMLQLSQGLVEMIAISNEGDLNDR